MIYNFNLVFKVKNIKYLLIYKYYWKHHFYSYVEMILGEIELLISDDYSFVLWTSLFQRIWTGILEAGCY